MTLLDEALKRNIHSKPRYSEEEMDLAVAWAEGRVRLSQVASVLSMPNTATAYNFLAMALREAWMRRQKG